MKTRTYVSFFFQVNQRLVTPIIIIIIIIIIKLEKKASISTILPPPFGLTLATALVAAAVLKLAVAVPTLVVLTALTLVPLGALDKDTLLAIPLPVVKIGPPPLPADVIVAELAIVAARTNTKSFSTTALDAIMGVPIACLILFL